MAIRLYIFREKDTEVLQDEEFCYLQEVAMYFMFFPYYSIFTSWFAIK